MFGFSHYEFLLLYTVWFSGAPWESSKRDFLLEVLMFVSAAQFHDLGHPPIKFQGDKGGKSPGNALQLWINML